MNNTNVSQDLPSRIKGICDKLGLYNRDTVKGIIENAKNLTFSEIEEIIHAEVVASARKDERHAINLLDYANQGKIRDTENMLYLISNPVLRETTHQTINEILLTEGFEYLLIESKKAREIGLGALSDRHLIDAEKIVELGERTQKDLTLGNKLLIHKLRLNYKFIDKIADIYEKTIKKLNKPIELRKYA